MAGSSERLQEACRQHQAALERFDRRVTVWDELDDAVARSVAARERLLRRLTARASGESRPHLTLIHGGREAV